MTQLIRESALREDANPCQRQPSPEPRLGFITTRHLPLAGYCGGLLILDMQGQPCEFHCSLPVQPSTTQKVLYGLRLQQFLIGHQITPALLQKSRCHPSLILLDDLAAVSVKTSVEFPLAVLRLKDPCSELDPDPADRGDIPGYLPDWDWRTLNNQTRIACRRQQELNVVEQFSSWFCLQEPFQRIREALHEAYQVAAA